MKKRILSLLLAIVMVATLLPTVALAEGESYGHPGHTCGTCGHINGDPHKTVPSANWTAWNDDDALPDSGTYYLTTDVTLSAVWQPTGDVTL